MDLKELLLEVLHNMSEDIEAFGLIDSKNYLNEYEEKFESYVTIQTAKARFRELVDLGSLRNGSNSKFIDHYEYRYKFLKVIIESDDNPNQKEPKES